MVGVVGDKAAASDVTPVKANAAGRSGGDEAILLVSPDQPAVPSSASPLTQRREASERQRLALQREQEALDRAQQEAVGQKQKALESAADIASEAEQQFKSLTSSAAAVVKPLRNYVVSASSADLTSADVRKGVVHGFIAALASCDSLASEQLETVQSCLRYALLASVGLLGRVIVHSREPALDGEVRLFNGSADVQGPFKGIVQLWDGSDALDRAFSSLLQLFGPHILRWNYNVEKNKYLGVFKLLRGPQFSLYFPDPTHFHRDADLRMEAVRRQLVRLMEALMRAFELSKSAAFQLRPDAVFKPTSVDDLRQLNMQMGDALLRGQLKSGVLKNALDRATVSQSDFRLSMAAAAAVAFTIMALDLDFARKPTTCSGRVASSVRLVAAIAHLRAVVDWLR